MGQENECGNIQQLRPMRLAVSPDSTKRQDRILCYGRWVSTLVIVAAWAFAPTISSAQDDPRVSEARAHFEQGEEHYGAGQYALASIEYQRAYDLLSAAGHENAGLVLFNVGRSLQELGGRDAEARQAYAGFLAEARVNNETADRIRLAQSHIRELDARLLRRGQQDHVQPTARSISPVGPVILAGGGAILLSGLVIAGVAFGQDQDNIASCPGRIDCDTALRSSVDSTRELAVAGDVLWIAGATVALAGLVLTLVLQDESDQQTAIAVQGMPDGGGLASVRWRTQ